MIVARPIGPAPTIAIVSPGLTRPLRTPTSNAVGRMSARNSTCSSLSPSGTLYTDVSANGTRAYSACRPSMQVAEDPAAAAGALARVTFLAVVAAAAGRDARHEHAVAGRDRRHRRADLGDRADRLVAEDRPGSHVGHVALEDVQIGAADRRRVDADDRVRRLLDPWFRAPLPRRAGPGRGRRDPSSEKLL